MLVRSQPELALVYLRDLSQCRLEITSRFVLHASIFDEARKMVFSILASLPAKVVNVTVECEVSCRLELEAKKFLDFCLEYVEAHSIDRVLQTGVLSTVQRCWPDAQIKQENNALGPVTVVLLHKHNFLCDYLTLLWRHEAENTTRTRIRLFAPMCNTHPTPSCHVEASQFTAFINDGDIADIVGKDVYVINWGHCNSNLELRKGSSNQVTE